MVYWLTCKKEGLPFTPASSLENSSIDLPFISKRDVHFYCTAFDYSRSDLNGFHHQTKDVPCVTIFTIRILWDSPGWKLCIYPYGFQLVLLLPIISEMTSFVQKRINLLCSNSSSGRLVIMASVLVYPKLAYTNKTWDSVQFQIYRLCEFWWIAAHVFNKCRPAIPPLLNDPKVLSSTSEKSKLTAEICSENNSFTWSRWLSRFTNLLIGQAYCLLSYSGTYKLIVSARIPKLIVKNIWKNVC